MNVQLNQQSEAMRILQDMQIMKNTLQGDKTANVENHGGFSSVLKEAIDKVSQLQNNAESLQTAYEHADPSVSLVDVMLATQKANVSLQATLQIRNKLLSAFHDLMSISV